MRGKGEGEMRSQRYAVIKPNLEAMAWKRCFIGLIG